MSNVALRFQNRLHGWAKSLWREKPIVRDETALFTDEQIQFLAGRGVIYLTVQPSGEFSTIIAQDAKAASRIAFRRNADEKVVGLMGFGFLRHLRNPSLTSRPMHDPDTSGSIVKVHPNPIYA
jgi:hypothetical protein